MSTHHHPHHKKHYKVHAYKQNDGILAAENFLFEELEEAIKYIRASSFFMAKVYNELDELIHEMSSPCDTYA